MYKRHMLTSKRDGPRDLSHLLNTRMFACSTSLLTNAQANFLF